jgi:hypothetical protein
MMMIMVMMMMMMIMVIMRRSMRTIATSKFYYNQSFKTFTLPIFVYFHSYTHIHSTLLKNLSLLAT